MCGYHASEKPYKAAAVALYQPEKVKFPLLCPLGLSFPFFFYLFICWSPFLLLLLFLRQENALSVEAGLY